MRSALYGPNELPRTNTAQERLSQGVVLISLLFAGLNVTPFRNAAPVAASTLPFPKTSSLSTASEKAHEELIWLNNDKLKVGLSPLSGGAIAWISAAGADRNLINSFDRGRLIQQSWYGREDGSYWNKTPWRWNPVQGGDWRGKSAVILEQKHEPTKSWVKSRPLHWGTGELLTECTMEQTVTLKDELLHIRFRFQYSGTESHPAHHQELPAFFVDSRMATLVLYDGGTPWAGAPITRSQPGFPNEYKRITEHWAAYVDEKDNGIGCYVPLADELTCYRFGLEMNSLGSCSYFAPIKTLAITPGFDWEYDVWITPGTCHEIRDRFMRLFREHQGAIP